MPEDHRGDCAGEVVVSDVLGWDAAQSRERLDMTFEERLLRLGRVDPVDGFPGMGQSIDEHVALRLHPVQHHPDLTKVHFSLRPRRVLLRNEYLDPASGLDIDLRTPDPDVVAHRGIRQLFRAVLVNEPGQNPAGGMALFPRRRRVLEEHRVDRGFEWLKPSGHSLSGFAIRR